jgi:hypothetical protein
MAFDTLFVAIVSLVIIGFLIGMVIWRQIVFDRREQDLITRLMSRDAIEYANVRRITSDSSITVEDAVDKLAREGIGAEEIMSSDVESIDRVRVR